ncbi:MAG: adenosylcobalamin-dependent ribonucleoside-diphosphate reductase [Candidatus Woesearchaeota archaeon]
MSIKEKNIFKNDFSKEVWETTYKNYNDIDVSDNWERIAKDLSKCEEDSIRETIKNQFKDLISDFKFVPAGRIYSNAGTEWSGTTYINCFVSDRNKYDIDSIEGIYSVLRDQSLTLKSEGGWGCNFSFIRPRGSFIHGIGVESPGPVSFMGLFNKSSEVITSGSGKKSTSKKAKKKIRKGAMMGILDIWHPSIEEFVTAKQKEGVLDKFNISVGVYNDFMDKIVKIEELQNTLKLFSLDDEEREKILKEIQELDKWELVFPDTTYEKYKTEWVGDIYDWKDKGYPVIVHNTVSATKLWGVIMESTYKRNDPGVLFLDIANKTHCWNYGDKRISRILATNPCGEQALPSGGCCNLGSFNLTQYLNENYTDFDYDKIKKDVRVAVRLLDNVNTRSGAPLDVYKKNMVSRRRIGIGFMGWGSSLMLLKTRYGSHKAEKIKERLLKVFTHNAVDASIDLAIEKGMFEGCDPNKHADHIYFDMIGLPEKTKDRIRKYGIRNSALFSLQPTGNTGILANNVTGGIEPLFMPEYIRTSIVPVCPDHILGVTPKYWEGEFFETEMFKITKEGSDDVLVGVDEFGITYKIDKNRGLTKETICSDYAVSILKERGEWDPDAEWAATTTQLSAKEHIEDIRGWAKYIDSAISKTVNLPENYSYNDFKDIYLNCYKTGVIKGFTTYRAGTMTSVMKAIDKESGEIMLQTNKAPKRPKELDADIHIAMAKGEKYIVAVGLLNGQPYEVFGGKANGFGIKNTCKGKLIKHKRGQYGLEIDDQFEIDDFSKHFTPEEQTIFRLASTNLRHGIPIEFVVEQMKKSTDDMFSLPSAVARVLKKYIKDGQSVSGMVCDNCGSNNIVYQEGCHVCKDCGNSKCS